MHRQSWNYIKNLDIFRAKSKGFCGGITLELASFSGVFLRGFVVGRWGTMSRNLRMMVCWGAAAVSSSLFRHRRNSWRSCPQVRPMLHPPFSRWGGVHGLLNHRKQWWCRPWSGSALRFPLSFVKHRQLFGLDQRRHERDFVCFLSTVTTLSEPYHLIAWLCFAWIQAIGLWPIVTFIWLDIMLVLWSFLWQSFEWIHVCHDFHLRWYE